MSASLVAHESGSDFLDSHASIFGSTWNVSSGFVHLYLFVCVGCSMTSPNMALGA